MPAMAPAATLSEYIDDLKASGVRVHPGTAGTYWVASPQRVLRRVPTFDVGTPQRSEVDEALRATGALIASYLIEPDDDHAVNSWLYLCGTPEYSLDMLPPPMQRNVRRGLRELTIEPVDATQLLVHGSRAFCDTRERNGLDDGTPTGFRRYFHNGTPRRGRTYLAAWKGDQLAAFMTIVRVDDWVEIGCFSMTSLLWCRPNDALLYVALSTYLAEKSCRVATYGVSSVQLESKAAGLHRFKRKVGFDARPVHREFVLHPAARPFASTLALRAVHAAVNGMLRVQRRHHQLRKLQGMLACILGSARTLPAAEQSPGYGTRRRRSWCTT